MQKKTGRALGMAAAGAVASMFATVAGAQQVNYTTGTYTQNFDALPVTGFNGTQLLNNTAGPFDLTQQPPDGFAAGAALSGWYAGRSGGANALKLYTDDGTSLGALAASVGALASFGATGAADRALGSQTNGAASARYGVKLVNNSTTAFTSFKLDYDVEQWAASQATVDFLNRVDYSIGATDLNNGTYVSVAPAATDLETTAGGGTLNSVVAGPSGKFDGNATKAAKSFTVSNIAWQPGQALFIRFNDNNDAGTDAGLAIDNFAFTATGAAQLLVWNSPVGGNWDTNALNKVWLDGVVPASFTTGAITEFRDTAINVPINVDAAGVTTAQMRVLNTNAAGSYTFSGGKITGGLIKTGAGTLVLASANDFTAASLTDGTVETRASDALGTNAVTLTNILWKATTADQVHKNAIAFSGTATISTTVGLDLGATTPTGAAAAAITLENTSGKPLIIPNFGGFAGSIHFKSGEHKYTGTTDGDLFASATIVTVDAGATLDWGLNGDTVGAIEGGGTIIITDAPGSFINVEATGNHTFSGVIKGNTTNTGSLGLQVEGGQVLTLSGKSTYTAPTTVNNGRIIFEGDVLINTDGPLGHTDTAVRLGRSTSTADVSLRAAIASEFARPINVTSNTNAGLISIGTSNDVTSIYSGQITLNGNGVAAEVTKPLRISNPVSLNNGTNLLRITGAIIPGTNAENIGVEKVSTGIAVLEAVNTYTGPTTVSDGILRITGSIANSSGVTVADGKALEIGSTQSIKTLTLNGASQLRFTAGGPIKNLKVGDGTSAAPVTLSPGTAGAKFDLGGNAATVDVSAGNEVNALKAVRTAIIAGYNGGNWQGPAGITSSVAQASNSRAVGYALAGEVVNLAAANPQFLGQPVDASSVVMRLTLAGDATLDGSVDFNDLVKLAQNYNTSVELTSESWWNRGDFTYDGQVDFNDLVKLAQNYNTSLPVAGAIPGAPAGFDADVARAFAAVPEPTGLSFLGVAVAAALGRRRARRHA